MVGWPIRWLAYHACDDFVSATGPPNGAATVLQAGHLCLIAAQTHQYA